MSTLNGSSATTGLNYKFWAMVLDDDKDHTYQTTKNGDGSSHLTETVDQDLQFDYYGKFSNYILDGGVEYPDVVSFDAIHVKYQGKTVYEWDGLLGKPFPEDDHALAVNRYFLAESDTITGGSVADQLAGFGGDDVIDGGAGTDTAAYFSNRADYSLSKTANGWSISGGSDGSDTLTNIERLQFSDKKVALDIDSNAGTVAKILASVFGASAVSNETYAGIGLNLLDGGMTYEALAALAINAAGAQTREAVVDLLWTNLMGSHPTTAEAKPFIDMLAQDLSNVGTLGVIAADFAATIGTVNLNTLSSTGLAYV